MHKLLSAGSQASGPWAAFWAAVFEAHAELTCEGQTNEKAPTEE